MSLRLRPPIDASLRSLETIYKGRELNFEGNAKLREAYMQTVQENIAFGSKAQDFLKSLPTMATSSAGGTITFGYSLATWLGAANREAFLALVGIALAGVGHLLHAAIVRAMRDRTQLLYVQQDYKRNLYYAQYISRTTVALISLYQDVDRIHQAVFGSPYPVQQGALASDIVQELFRGVRPTMCKYVHKHMREGVIRPGDWALCETGEPACQDCRHWK